MPPSLATDLRAEQRAFLRRDRRGWREHLARIRAFLGEGLRRADPGRPVLVLGAGSGLEVPWSLAPASTVGWDAEPWSRWRTFLRHRRWAPWVFEDLTGGLGDLEALVARALGEPWSGRRRDPEAAAARLAGLLPSLRPEPRALSDWIQHHRPGTILAANVMGQFGPVAHRRIDQAFAPRDPWEVDPERPDPLAEALDAWVAQAIQGFLQVLAASGADLWLVHDRGLLHGEAPVSLGPPEEPWTAQLRTEGELEVSDPLCGVEVGDLLPVCRRERWLWPLGPGQRHLMEAVFSPGSPGRPPGPAGP